MSDILVAGALHLDVVVDAPNLPRPDETVAGSAVAYRFGGKGGNQAVAAARMGARVAMAGAVGSDGFAETLLAGLDTAGVDRAQLRRLPGASGMSVAVVLPDGGYGAVIVSGANLAIRADDIALPPGLRLLLLQNEIPETVNAALARRARAAGARVILNTAPARAADPALLADCDIVIANRIEAADLTGADPATLDPRAAAEALRAAGAAAAIVTLGGEGLAGADAAGAFRQPGFAVPVASTHGAGDAFVGALAAALARGDDLRAAARFGQAAAALHVSTPPDARDRICAAAVSAFLAQHA